MTDGIHDLIIHMRETTWGYEAVSSKQVELWADRLEELVTRIEPRQLPVLGDQPTLDDRSDPPTFSTMVEELTKTNEEPEPYPSGDDPAA